ncbi:hypothetical protein [Nocardiopsis ansamitocini]|uniref:Pyrroloquinoline-quinone binding quinoprotein n=1 Tax=Nocardiopsis ansamitocini TaxID=1670832 RepID=A0A9W6P8S0_9ACTN|nr:hypothetical protein [Nocardiopsis ansamitocini]GLU49134.1 hypothetical protein Nans01_34850 [Nocardiopsis ansamitocini]
MRSRARGVLALTAGACLLVTAAACTDDPEPEAPTGSPPPLPTTYDGAAPPGLSGKALRFLHGPEGSGPDLLDDPLGVRIQAVGDSFLISANSEERHLLQDAADGRTLWEDSQRVERFTTDDSGDDVFEVSRPGDGTTVTTVLDDAGEQVWSGSDPREGYLNGWVVRRPADWTPNEPYGAFAIARPDGEAVWEYEFTEPEPPAAPEKEDDEEAADPTDSAEAEEAVAHLGVPVTARGEVVLLDDGAGRLQARDLDDDGALLWSVSGESPELAEDTVLSGARPQVAGFYTLDVPPDAEATGPATPSTSARPSPAPSASPAPPEERETVLVRWGMPEEPSVLSLHDLDDGALVWSLAEPGANPVSASLGTAPVPGTVLDPTTDTLLLPQSSGTTPMIAVDLATGAVRWQFEDQEERSIVPRFALGGYIYGDSRGAEDDSGQVVLEADDKAAVSDELTGYVEAITRDGHALVVQNRQRFVFAPEPDAPRPSDSPGPGA